MATSLDPDRRPHRFTVDEYLRMADLGLLPPDRRTELIEGEIVEVSPQGDARASTISRLNQTTLALSESFAPDPGIVLSPFRSDFYSGGSPTALDVQLIVEVAITSFHYNRVVKAPLYARHGIREYWIVVPKTRSVVVHRDPGENAYRTTTVWEEGRLAPLALPDRLVEHAALFGSLGG